MVLDSGDVGLRHTGAVGQHGLCPTQLDPSLTNRVAWVLHFGDRCELGHDQSVCVNPHEAK